jgi:two-component system heavy metal sensor histidine kinase CusS
VRLKDRLSLTLTLVTALALGASFSAVSFLVHREETGDLDRAILAQASAAAYLASQRDPLHPTVVDGQGEIPELPIPVRRYAAVYDAEGQVISATRSFQPAAPTYESLHVSGPITATGTALYLEVPSNHLRGVLVPVGDHGARLLYAVTRRSVDEDMRFLYEVFSVLFLAATGLTALVARWLGAKLSQDVDNIAGVARAVAGGDLTARVERGADGSTETRALGHDLDHMITQLGGLMDAQRTFISHAAHELRSPLATLRGELQLALRRPRSADEYKNSIEDALGEVDLLSALTEDLLVLARVQRVGVGAASAQLGDTLGEALRMARGPAQARRVSFVEPTDPALLGLSVRGSRADLSRALRNLVDNAVEHSPEGGQVTIEAHLASDRVCVAIVDQGEGVAPEDAPHIFSTFYRGSKDQSSEYRGTGLGLAIVREIVRSVGGDVRLDPNHRPGARFLLELPLSTEAAEAIVEHESHAENA